MKQNNLFSQQKLDELLGKGIPNEPQTQDPTNVRHHPSLTQENDISNHQALNNKFSDLSRLGGPAEIPGSNPPQQSELKSMAQGSHQLGQMSRMGDVQGTDRHMSQTPSPELNPSEMMVMQFMRQVLDNHMNSNAFCDQLVQMLCENVQFMTSLRSEIMQRLMQGQSPV